jgi:hypothetical protein
MVVKITAIRAKRRHANKHGAEPVAEFDFITEDIGMRRCTLVRLRDGRFKTWTPTLDVDAARSQREAECSVYFRAGSPLQEAVTEAAARSYGLLFSDIGDDTQDDDTGLMRTLAVEECVRVFGE